MHQRKARCQLRTLYVSADGQLPLLRSSLLGGTSLDDVRHRSTEVLDDELLHLFLNLGGLLQSEVGEVQGIVEGLFIILVFPTDLDGPIRPLTGPIDHDLEAVAGDEIQHNIYALQLEADRSVPDPFTVFFDNHIRQPFARVTQNHQFQPTIRPKSARFRDPDSIQKSPIVNILSSTRQFHDLVA